MATAGAIALLGVAALASFFTAWTIGAGSSGATPFAPAVGANAISVMRAGLIVGILGFVGAVLQGENVTHTIGGELVRGVTLSPLGATIVLLTSAGLIAIGIFTGYPIATAFAVTGAVVGVGLAMGGAPAWATYTEIGGIWLFTPFVGAGAAYGTARLLRSDRVSEARVVPLLAAVVGFIIAYGMEFTLLAPPGESATIADAVVRRIGGSGLAGPIVASILVAVALGLFVARRAVVDRDGVQRQFLLALGILVAFSAGGAKVGLAIGPLLPLIDATALHVPITTILVFGGFGLLLGSWMASTRMIKALAQDYSALGPRRSIAVLIPSFAIAQVAILFGLPMSFNEIFISTIVGSGYAAGGSNVSKRKMAYTGLAWIGSLVLAFALCYGAYWAITSVV
jgi:PiT family inorganic phosphate transporter